MSIRNLVSSLLFAGLLSVTYGALGNTFPYAAYKTIQEYVSNSSVIPSGERHTCTLSTTDDCTIDQMPRDESTVVYPGGETRCIFSTSTAYTYQVIPGDLDKLVVYFQGGGACYDKLSTNLGACTKDAVPVGEVGIFDRKNPLNPYKDFTIVFLMYCSGDAWAGNVTRPYNDKAGVPVTQHGDQKRTSNPGLDCPSAAASWCP
jgi:hypothetical protein